MGYSECDQAPVMLQLQKWGPSPLQYDLSEFREAFISPTRQLLLLLSYHHQALLLPLHTGNKCSEYVSGRNFLDPCTSSYDDHDAPNIKDHFHSTSDSLGACNSEELRGGKSQENCSYPFISDVNSLAWGAYGDTYGHQLVAPFKEFLFVSGSHGVTVHAFCRHDDTTSGVGNVGDSHLASGRWTEWGASVSIAASEEPSSNYSCNENADGFRQSDGMSGRNDSKKWLQSYFTEVKTVKESDGYFWVRLPARSSYPSTAKVVSFSLFGDTSDDPNLHEHVTNDCANNRGINLDPGDRDSNVRSSRTNGNSGIISALLGSQNTGPYHSSKVFSSASHQLLGFAIQLVDSSSADSGYVSKSDRKRNFVFVCRLSTVGLQWVSHVDLEDTPVSPAGDWTDFSFSGSVLVCLTSSGQMCFYSSMSGQYVGHLDILQACGLNLQLKEYQPKRTNPGVCIETEHSGDVCESASESGHHFTKMKFRRLVTASHTSLLGAIDENGITFVISAAEYLSDTCYPRSSLLPDIHNLGSLVGCVVNGYDISHTCLPKVQQTERVLSAASPLVGDMGTFTFQKFQRCTKGKPSGTSIQSKYMRKIFLPFDGFTKDDCICLSPLGITRLVRNNWKEKHCRQVRHHHLWVDSVFHDDKCLNSQEIKDHPDEVRVGCSFQGCLYVVTPLGLAVALPSRSGLSDYHVDPIELPKGERPRGIGEYIDVGQTLLHSHWKVRSLDQVILNEGLKVVDRLCGENGWDFKYPQMRQLQLALVYLKFDEIDQSLKMLLSVNLYEEGIMKMLFHTALLVSRKASIDNDVTAALRLLAVASSFATKILRICGSLQQNVEAYKLIGCCDQACTLSSFIGRMQNKTEKLKTLKDMAYLLEVIRSFQRRLGVKVPRPAGVENERGALILAKSVFEPDELGLSVVPVNLKSHGTLGDHENSLSVSSQRVGDEKTLALAPVEFYLSAPNCENVGDSTAIVPLGAERLILSRNIIPVENPLEMMTRWKTEDLDLKTVVKDALFSGRLPLAVLQLHLHRSGDLGGGKEKSDYFTEVRDIGRAIAYDLLLKGEIGLALETLQRLGEDIRTSLKQLLLGSLRRSLRAEIAEVMETCGYLGSSEHYALDTINLIERLYPSSCFWKTFYSKQEDYGNGTSNFDASREDDSQVSLSTLFTEVTIECGEVDGVVLGPWVNLSSNYTDYPVNEESALTGYWAAAAVWSNNWDQKTIDRVVLDQPFLMGVHLLWDSQLEYHISHNDWEEVAKLLDLVPPSSLSDGRLRIAFNDLQSPSTIVYNTEISTSEDYSCADKDIGAAFMDVPNVKIFRHPVGLMSSFWLRMRLEAELAKKFIFLQEFWGNTSIIVSLLAQSGFITGKHGIASDGNLLDVKNEPNIVLGLHKTFVCHCIQLCQPNLLDLYLDNHMPDLDGESLGSLLEAVGDCQWARWLLFSRVEGFEYEASFANCRSIITPGLSPRNNLDAQMIKETMRTVDEIAEGGGELAALATLMYAHVPIQNCLSVGSVKRQSSAAQCTLENLQPILQHFTTLRRALVAACFGQETPYSLSGNKARSVYGTSSLANYLVWREHIFFSSDRDTSLLQMLPCWFPKAVRNLVQLYIQGPLAWQSLTGPEYTLRPDAQLLLSSNEFSHISPISWEATIQKRIGEKLYSSSIKETGPGFEQYLNRGRSLAAFNHLLSVRVQKFKSEGDSGALEPVQGNIQSDIQALLAPISHSEEDLISYVVPVAIIHFDDPVLVSACVFFLELCGLSASMLRVDIAALRRIASFYDSHEHVENFKQLSPKGSVVHAISKSREITESLSRALADEYFRKEHPGMGKQKKANELQAGRSSSQGLTIFLQHLEKASLPHLSEGKTCGTWLYKGTGEGHEMRMQQKAASQCWNLVTDFCQMHQLPLSTKYLELLAKDSDWVGFLSEAQLGGYPLDTVIQVSKEFSDPRLKLHILTVLKCVLSRKKTGSSSDADSSDKANGTCDYDMYNPAELFGILANCEKQQRPGEALLTKAKELLWSILAIIASCFQDVSSLTCLRVWLEISAARETSSIKVNNMASQIASNVAAAVKSCNSHQADDTTIIFHYNRKNPKRRRLLEPALIDNSVPLDVTPNLPSEQKYFIHPVVEDKEAEISTPVSLSDSDNGTVSLSKMVAVLCEQGLFFPLLRAFELFLPSCSLLPFFRALQAFSQMRLPEAAAHLGSFSIRLKEDLTQTIVGKDEHIQSSWITTMSVTAADAVLSTCPSPYEKRCLLQLLANTDFGDGGCAASNYRRLYWKIDFAEPSLRKDQNLHFGNETLDDASLLQALENNGNWEQARDWARQLDASGGPWKSAVHHVTEVQAESMVAEWKQFLWDVPEERVALWGHCQSLFIRHSFPPQQAGTFFLKHAENLEKDLPAKELLELLLLSLQWFSGMITHAHPVCQLHLLREIETRIWLLAVESEAQLKTEGESNIFSSSHETHVGASGIVDRTARIIAKMDNHISSLRTRKTGKHDLKDSGFMNIKHQGTDASVLGINAKTKRRTKGSTLSRKPIVEMADKMTDFDDGSINYSNYKDDLQSLDENERVDFPISKWEDRVGQAEVETAVLLLLEFGQISAAKQLQQKLSPDHVPAEFLLVDAALKLAAVSYPPSKISVSMLDEKVCSVLQSFGVITDERVIDPLQVFESLITLFSEGSGRGLCKRIVAIVKAAKVLGISFSETFEKQPIEVLQLLSLKAQESFEEAKLLVQTHSMSAASIAQILAESFLKGLLAAHRGGYIDAQKEEGPAPLLWRFSDFMKWAELCPSEPEIGHALMRLVITGQEIPHACEVELLILSHHFYKSSACLDGVDVLVALAATRVDSYVSEGDFSCLARLITGVGNFHALNFILGILIENGQLDLLLQKFSAAANAHGSSAEVVRGFRMAVLTSLKQFNPNDLDAFAMVYSHFDMKHETASLLESRAEQACNFWLNRYDKDQNEDLLDSMRYYIEAGEVHSSIDAGNKTGRACAQASLLSLQIRMPDLQWLNRSETNARRALVEQSRFQEALIVAEAYNLNQPSEWALVLWNLMLHPELTEAFVAEFVSVLPLQPSMLIDLARFYRSEIAARGDQSQFSVWLTGGGLPAEWAKYLARSFRCLLKRTRDLRLRLQLASTATGFADVIDACTKALDKVPENAGPLVLRRGHGGAYLPLM
ncbi:hypothetical protein MLD38_035669 [Melastoma candidum]|uniref:Uncharacterized protein n=1 Tax=Melastoma candidum TaxID=119954 RepID=A0ACB9LJ34_9MYRT|nr:hypothetical protein MLD38_035669 [Melastoma candidum]